MPPAGQWPAGGHQKVPGDGGRRRRQEDGAEGDSDVEGLYIQTGYLHTGIFLSVKLAKEGASNS